MEGAAVASIIQRWEWRTFGEGLRAAEKACATRPPTQVVDSDELYLLSASDGNVKVRDDLLDIKLLREVDDDGLERWEPVLKAAFPVTAAEVPRGFEAFGAPPPPLARDACTLGEFLEELVLPSGAARAVRVHKRRVRYTLGGRMGQLSGLDVA